MYWLLKGPHVSGRDLSHLHHAAPGFGCDVLMYVSVLRKLERRERPCGRDVTDRQMIVHVPNDANVGGWVRHEPKTANEARRALTPHAFLPQAA